MTDLSNSLIHTYRTLAADPSPAVQNEKAAHEANRMGRWCLSPAFCSDADDGRRSIRIGSISLEEKEEGEVEKSRRGKGEKRTVHCGSEIFHLSSVCQGDDGSPLNTIKPDPIISICAEQRPCMFKCLNVWNYQTKRAAISPAPTNPELLCLQKALALHLTIINLNQERRTNYSGA